MQFDECNNAFMKPKPPVYCGILNSLHKKSDYEWMKTFKPFSLCDSEKFI